MKRLLMLVFLSVIGGSAWSAQGPGKDGVKGGLAPEVIEKGIDKHLAEISLCYKKELLAAAKPFGGTIKTHFEVGPRGRVEDAEVVSSTLNNEKVETCLLKVLTTVQYPSPVGEGSIGVDYPFTFQPDLAEKMPTTAPALPERK